MPLALVHSRALDGLNAPEVTVEVHLANGLPSFTLVGLADTEVKEARERVRAALLNSGLAFPHNQRITVNLAPADLPKESGRFDLPIALGILAASGQIDAQRLAGCEFAGELSLGGDLRSVRVLSRLFRRRFLEELQRLHQGDKLKFFGEHAGLADARAFKAWLTPLRKVEWVVYAKRPFAGPKAVLAYLSRYTHRVAISNSRLLAMDDRGVTFKWKDYRAKGQTRHKAMTLAPQEFMRRFLLHVLPGGFHRIRHYGLLANGSRKVNLALARELLHVAPAQVATAANTKEAGVLPPAAPPAFVCRHCGHAMVILQTFTRGELIRAPPPS